MKEHIISALKTKYKNMGFSDKVFETVADTLTDRVKEESEIETSIAGVEALLKAIQGEADKARTEKANAEKQLKELKKQIEELTKKTDPEPPKPDPTEPPKGGDPMENEFYKKLLEQFQTVAEQVKSLQIEKVVESRKSVLSKALEGAPDWAKLPFEHVDVNSFKTDDEFTSFVEKAKTTVSTSISEAQKQGLNIPNPVGGKGEPQPKKIDPPSEAQMKELAKMMGI